VAAVCDDCLYFISRSASMRTISMLSSRASTPRYGTLNSHRDLHPSSASLATSASRTLDRPRPSTLERGTARSRQGGSVMASQSSFVDRRPFESENFNMNGCDGNGSAAGSGFSKSSFQTFHGRVSGRPVAGEQEPGLNNNVPGHGYMDMSVSRGLYLVLLASFTEGQER
jgi:hypothetical protein